MPRPPRAEHRLADTLYAKRQLAKFAKSLKKWREAEAPTNKEASKRPLERQAMIGLSRRELGIRVGCHEQQIANIENRRSYPSFSLYAILCRAIGIQPVADFPVKERPGTLSV